MKRLDDLEAKREPDAERTGEKYFPRFAGKLNIPGSNESIDKNEFRCDSPPPAVGIEQGCPQGRGL
jgi:hypothetical protein